MTATKSPQKLAEQGHIVCPVTNRLPKPYYDEDGITIYHGDSAKTLPISCDLLLTDVPYGEVNRADSGLRNLNYGIADTETMPIKTLSALLIKCAASSMYVFCGTEQVSHFRKTFSERGMSTRLCVWEKTNPSPMNGQHLWLSSVECCVFGKRNHGVFNAFCESSCWRGKSSPKPFHPTAKPEWLFRKLICASSNEGDVVLDPFMGSGTTLRAAKDCNRKAIGIEIEERYCEIAAKRLAQKVLF